MKSFNLGSSSSDLALVAKGKYPYRGQPWDKNKGGKLQEKQKGMTQSEFPIHKRNDECYYCGKPGNHSKDCYKGNIMSLGRETEGIMEILWTKISMMDLKILNCLFLMLHCLWKMMIRMLGSLILGHHYICLVIRSGLMNIMKTLMEHMFA